MRYHEINQKSADKAKAKIQELEEDEQLRLDIDDKDLAGVYDFYAEGQGTVRVEMTQTAPNKWEILQLGKDGKPAKLFGRPRIALKTDEGGVKNYIANTKAQKVSSYKGAVEEDEDKKKETLNPPSIDVGDEVKVGKFRNVKATVKGFKKDDHNQPVLKTNKGDKKLFSLRLSKLQEDELAQAEKDVDDEMKMKKANLKVNAAKRRHQQRIEKLMKDAGYVEEDLKGAIAGAALAAMGVTAASGTYAYDKLLTTDEPTAQERHIDSFRANAKQSQRQRAREDAPPGREKQVKALKGKVDNPYAVAWASYNKSKGK